MSPVANYKSLQHHYERKFREHGDNHRGVDWPNENDAQRRYDVMLGVIPPDAQALHLLDIGCGLAHLYEWILATGNRQHISYEGLDISPTFTEVCRTKHPNIPFHTVDLLAQEPMLKADRQFDYVVLNGVFTEKLSMSDEEMLSFFYQLLSIAFGFARKGLAFNVMSRHVDWERDDLFHLSFDDMASFVTKDLTRNFVIRSDYGLFEYTTYLYR